MREPCARARVAEAPRHLRIATTVVLTAVIVALFAAGLPCGDARAEQQPQQPVPPAFEDSLRAEIRKRQDRIRQLRVDLAGTDDERLNEAMQDLEEVVKELEGELEDLEIQVDENAVLFSNPSGEVRIQFPENLGSRVSEGISAITAAIMAEVPDSVEIQEGIRQFQKGAQKWSWNVFGEEAPKPKRRLIGDEITSLSESVVVADDERVAGDVVVLLGDATILGEVEGEVVVVGGDLILGEDADVHASVTVLFGEMLRDEDARIGGNINVVNMSRLDTPWAEFGRGPATLVAKLTGLFVLGVLLVIVMALLPETRLEVVEQTLQQRAGRSLLAGALWLSVGHLLLVIVLVVLVVTVVGIPLALLLVLAYLMLGLIAVGVTTGALGRRLCGRRCSGRLMPLVFGLVLISLPGILGSAMWSLSSDAFLSARLLLLLGVGIHLLIYSLGSGAVLTSRFGTRLPDFPRAGDPSTT